MERAKKRRGVFFFFFFFARLTHFFVRKKFFLLLLSRSISTPKPTLPASLSTPRTPLSIPSTSLERDTSEKDVLLERGRGRLPRRGGQASRRRALVFTSFLVRRAAAPFFARRHQLDHRLHLLGPLRDPPGEGLPPPLLQPPAPGLADDALHCRGGPRRREAPGLSGQQLVFDLGAPAREDGQRREEPVRGEEEREGEREREREKESGG